MKIYEIGTGYTSIPAKISAATELVVEELTKSMIDLKVDVKILDIQDKNRLKNNLPIEEISIPTKLSSTDVQLGLMHKLKRVVYSINLSLRLKKILKNEKERIFLHFHNQYNLFFFLKLTSKKLRKKCIIMYTNHSGIWSKPWSQVKKIIQKRYFQEIYSMKNADIIFVLNKNMKKSLMDNLKIDESKIKVVPNGVNVDVYKKLENKNSLKQKFGLENKEIILQVGSVYENKSQKKAIKLIEPLLRKNPNLNYVFAGGIVSQEYYDEIMEYVEKVNLKNQIKYIGMIKPGEELCELYNVANFCIFMSDYEGFPLVVIESLACGVPILLRKDFPIEFGSGIIKSDSNNICEMYEKFANSNELSNASRENVLENYSWNSIAKLYLQEVKKL